MRWSAESADALDAEQRRLATIESRSWGPGPGSLLVGGCFLAFASGQQGPGHAGDRGWAGAAVVRCPELENIDGAVVPSRAGAPYDPGRLALREGPALAAAVDALTVRPEVLLVDATGRDHPRGAGLAVHLGARLGLPSIGVTNRALVAGFDEPGMERGSVAPLLLDGEVVGYAVRTRAGVNPVLAHAGWRTSPALARDLVLALAGRWRTPPPLREARTLARAARAAPDRAAT